MISCSRFQVRPQGSFINTLIFSMVVLLGCSNYVSDGGMRFAFPPYVLGATGSFTALIFTHRNHAVEKLLRRQIIHQPQARAFLALAVQKNHRGHAFDGVVAQ